MESIDECELPLDQQLFNCQLELETKLKSINSSDNGIDSNDNPLDGQTLIFEYLDHILDNKLQTVDDFGNDLEWLNVEHSLSLRNNLQGLLVVIDFFTYCCINCLHILPNLNKIEKQYQSQGLVVIGVHSPKFNNEKDITNVADAVLKYDIDHPIANDPSGKVWSSLSIQCWPTLVILGPNSQVLFTLIGESGIQDYLQLYTKTALNYFKLKNMIITENKFKIPIKLLRDVTNNELLRFPGKISASDDGQLLAISDTHHHNIIVAQNNGLIKFIIGGNESGFRDGSFTDALFNSPQGIVWRNNNIIYVADTHNHAIRMIHINNKTVITLAGNGKQSDDRVGGNIGTDQGLNSPWDLSYADNRLFIAMAGSHQIWVLSLKDNTEILKKFYPEGCCLCFAGDGAEQNRNNRFPHKASFAQPSGLAFDSISDCLYVADSESSSVRCVDISTGSVKAMVGGDRNPLNLFAFGDLDGRGIDCRLQHCLGVAFDSNTQSLFVADSYNHKIKQIMISSKECITIAGFGESGNRSNCKLLDCSFNEPNGLCFVNGSNTLLVTDTNNHCLKRLDLENDFVTEFKLIKINDRMSTDCVDKELAESSADFNIQLNSINLNVKNKLKLEINLDFGQQIKLTTGAKQLLYFVNPDETVFTSSHKQIQIENLEDLPHFLITVKNKTNDQILEKSYKLMICANLNLCNSNLNFCKQVKVAFHLPILMCNEDEEESTLTVDLPFNLETLTI